MSSPSSPEYQPSKAEVNRHDIEIRPDPVDILTNHTRLGEHGPSSAPQTPRSPLKRTRESDNDERTFKSKSRKLTKYSDHYRQLFNSFIEEVRDRYEIFELDPLPPSQIGLSRWTSEEKDTFFTALALLGRHNAAGIAAAVGSKSEAEVQDYELLLRQGMLEAHLEHPKDQLLAPTKFLAASQVGRHCQRILDDAAESLARKQWQYEAREEEQKHGDYWRLDQELAKQIEQEFAYKEHRTKRTKYARDASSNSRLGDDDTIESTSTSPPLEKVPAAELFRIERWLDISHTIFMSQILPQTEMEQKAFIDGGEDPGIMHTAFADFYTLTVALTRRLVQVSLFKAMSRLRSSKDPKVYGKIEPAVLPGDVRAALQTLGMPATSEIFWATTARRNRLDVINVPVLPKKDRKLYSYVKQLMEGTDTGVLPSPDAVRAYLQAQVSNADETHRLRLDEILRRDRRILHQSIKRAIAFAAYKRGLCKALSYDLVEQELRRPQPRRRSRSSTAESTDSQSSETPDSDHLDPMIGLEGHTDAGENRTPPDKASDIATDSEKDSIMDIMESTHHEVAQDMYLELYDQHNSIIEEQRIMETLGLRDYHPPRKVPKNVLARLTAERKAPQDLVDWRDHANQLSLWETRLLDRARRREIDDQSEEAESSGDERRSDDGSPAAESDYLQELAEKDADKEHSVQGSEPEQDAQERLLEDEQNDGNWDDVDGGQAAEQDAPTQVTAAGTNNGESLDSTPSNSESEEDNDDEAEIPSSPPPLVPRHTSVESNDEAEDSGQQGEEESGEEQPSSGEQSSRGETTDFDSDARSRPAWSLPRRLRRTVSRGRTLPSAAFDLSD